MPSSDRRRTSSPPPAFIQSTCSASRKSVASAGVLYVWLSRELEMAVVSDERFGDPPAVTGRRDLFGPREGGRAERGQPQAAVGAEGLLRREVVGVGVRDVDREAACARRRVDQDELAVGSGGPLDAEHGAGRRLVVRPRDGVDVRIGGRSGRGSGVGADDDRIVQVRGALGDAGELRAELAEGQVQRAPPDEAGCRGVPERGGAAVAENDLVAVRQAEELAQPVPHATDDVLDRRLPVRCAHPLASAPGTCRAPPAAPWTGRSRSVRRQA